VEQSILYFLGINPWLALFCINIGNILSVKLGEDLSQNARYQHFMG
jgi:hypothetical protein